MGTPSSHVHQLIFFNTNRTDMNQSDIRQQLERSWTYTEVMTNNYKGWLNDQLENLRETKCYSRQELLDCKALMSNPTFNNLSMHLFNKRLHSFNCLQGETYGKPMF